MQIQSTAITEIRLNPNNPRVIKDDKFKKLVKSIQEFPEMLDIRPIVVNDQMIVLGGNMRLKACIEAGLTEVPVIMASSLTPEQQQEFIIKDNVGFGEWEWDVLANEWDVEKLTEWGLDIPDYEPKVLEAEEDDFEVPNEVQTDIVLGDLFEIGNHRLLCGDSTDSDQVAKLMNGENPIIMVTDPPYGVNYDATWREDALGDKLIGKPRTGLVSNDDKADWSEVWSLFTGNIAYVWHASAFTDVVMESLRKCDLIPTQQIIWKKTVMVLSRQDYHWQHEPCWYCIRKGKTHNWKGDRKQTTIFEAAPPTHIMSGSKEEKTIHPTQKALECMAMPIRNNTEIGDIVYEPFTGSGTTMVASHQLKRKCYGMELDPKYCQVIVDRMRKLDPNIVIKKNGQTV